MTSTTASKAEIIQRNQIHPSDCGSCEVQVALLSDRITSLTGHLKLHPKDHHTRRGLILMVGRRNRLLTYLRSTDAGRYEQLIEKLGIRGVRASV